MNLISKFFTLYFLLLAATSFFGCAPCEEWDTAAFWQTATIEEVSDCLEAGANPNAGSEDGITPFHLAAISNANPAVITALLEAGADINAQGKLGLTALHTALLNLNTNPVVMTTLLDAGVDINAQNKNGYTPLHTAVLSWNPNPAVITTLLEAGADPKVRDKEGKTPSDHAKTNESLKETDASWQLLLQGK